MHCLDTASTQQLLGRLGVLAADWRSGKLGKLIGVKCPSVSKVLASQTMYYARFISHALWESEPPTCLVYVFETQVWPSSENLSLYYCWRKSLDVHTPLSDAPGHLFLPFEQDQMASLLQMALLFGWGTASVGGDGVSGFTIDHDGDMHAFADSSQRLKHMLRGLTDAPAVN